MSSLLAQYSSDGLSRNLREMCWGGNNNFVSRAGGGEETEKTLIIFRFGGIFRNA